MTAATDASAALVLESAVFPDHLRVVMAPHIDKAKTSRKQALDAIERANRNAGHWKSLQQDHADSALSKEGTLSFDPVEFPLREVLLTSGGLPATTDLSRLHEQDDDDEKEGVPDKKWRLLKHLTTTPNHQDFQSVYDDFVRRVCCPKLADLWNHHHNNNKPSNPLDTIYYQCFPCLRIVQPGAFSIGPHADVAYGHHPWSTNFYVLLTDLVPEHSSAALFLERKPGTEDWHPILGHYGEHVTHFMGGSCLHWTAENNTSTTRVSLDFRLLPGPWYDAVVDGSGEPGGKVDVFRKTPGYYSQCRLRSVNDNSEWERVGPLLAPDARVGFPWTVSNWERFLADQERRRI